MLQKQNEAFWVPAMLIFTALSVAKKIYDNEMSASGKACQGKQGYALDVCVRNFKTKALNSKIVSLKKEMAKCSNTEKPEKCRKTFMKHINKIQNQMIKINSARRKMEMDINRLKLGLMYIFNESKKIPSKSKLHLFRFIEQADEFQLKVLALDGEIVSNSFDKTTKKIIDARCVSENIPALTVGASTGALTWATSRYQLRKTNKDRCDT